ncbi:uncharacterized protein LOC123311514 isoform X1 [Coccinella septempunctata]|uniref:uncharacterized protein LOC123311514 isoform X1 n=1 Tax=Coccinella septempunctata TaxID=41139 RepID=UPI001D07D05A|nr:uncharacterized protein LOC123311514 isoform X1 [Coccinella septempunctata]
MVGYAPALLAMALNLDGVHIFKEPRATNNGPYLSCFIFMIAVFIFATHLEIYPSHFRKLWWCGNMILQFLCTQLMFEYLLADFWFPVEESFSCLITHTVEVLDQWDQMESMKNVLEALKCETTGIVCSYLLSCFFLLAALHSTRVINFTLLDCGLGPFVKDIYRSAEEFLIASLVNFTYQKTCGKARKQTNSCKKKDFEDTDDEGEWHPSKKYSRRRH